MEQEKIIVQEPRDEPEPAVGEPLPTSHEPRVAKVVGFAGEILVAPVNPAYFHRDPATGYARQVQAGL